MVHERFTPEDIKNFRAKYDGVVVLAHPECPQEVLAEADYTGSTQQMIDYVEGERPERVVLITECSMSDNIAAANPDMELVRPCQMCPHMKRITLPKILSCLRDETPEVLLSDDIAAKSLIPIQKMLDAS
jgi:quinolinate synthase